MDPCPVCLTLKGLPCSLILSMPDSLSWGDQLTTGGSCAPWATEQCLEMPIVIPGVGRVLLTS